MEPADMAACARCAAPHSSPAHPIQCKPARRAQWQKVARMDPADMAAVCNLAHLGVPVMKGASASGAKAALSSFGLPTGKSAAKRGLAYRKREGRGEGSYALSRWGACGAGVGRCYGAGVQRGAPGRPRDEGRVSQRRQDCVACLASPPASGHRL